MAGLDPAIHVLQRYRKEDVDTRDIGAKQRFVASPGHDAMEQPVVGTVMAGLDPAIHVLRRHRKKTWIPVQGRG